MGSGEEGSLSLQTDLCQLQEKLTKESEMPFDARSCFVYVLKGSCWALVKSVFILFLGAMMSYHVNHFLSLGPRPHFFQICLVCSFLPPLFFFFFWIKNEVFNTTCITRVLLGLLLEPLLSKCWDKDSYHQATSMCDLLSLFWYFTTLFSSWTIFESVPSLLSYQCRCLGMKLHTIWCLHLLRPCWLMVLQSYRYMCMLPFNF